jgi:hypothetical protein
MHMSSIRVIELESLDRKSSRAVLVPLPAAGGRVRVAVVPVRDEWLLTSTGQAALRQALLSRCP